MTITKHQNSHPNVPALVEDLDSFAVRYVLIGSVAASFYGVEMQPGDMDIAPTLDHANLTHLYLQTTEDQFNPWEKHKNNYQFMGSLPWSPHDEPDIGEPYRKEEVLEYLKFCQGHIDDKVAALNLEAESGFTWIPFDKMELQFYSIRHLQHHTGELCERLGTRANIDVGWVGMKHDDKT